MERYKKIIIDCQAGMKALQNVRSSVIGFVKILELGTSADHIIQASLFYWAVIRYAKPFLDSKHEGRNIRYKTRHLKKAEGFSEAIHEHLLRVRNTLVAHDDFTQVMPRILAFGMELRDEKMFIPTTISISNKCLSFPLNTATIEEMQHHATGALKGIYSRLMDDLSMMRRLAIEDPDAAALDTIYRKNYGDVTVPADGAHLVPPQYINDSWLDPPAPDFSEVCDGYRYERATVKHDFNGPEEIRLPDGGRMVINPNKPR